MLTLLEGDAIRLCGGRNVQRPDEEAFQVCSIQDAGRGSGRRRWMDMMGWDGNESLN